MNTKILLAFLISLSFTTSALCLPQEEKSELSNTTQASCVIKIVATDDILPWNNIGQSVSSILVSSNVGGKTAKQILGVTPVPLFWKCLTVNIISVSQKADVYEAMISLSIDLESVDAPVAPAAEEFLFALLEEFRQSLIKSYEDSQTIWTQQIDLAEKNADTAESKLRDLQREQYLLRINANLPDLSRDAILKDANNIQTKIEQEEFNLSSMDWRRDSVLEQMRFFREKIEEEIIRNIVIKELQNLVDIQTKELERILKLKETESGISDDRLIQAEEKLAKAKIELAQKKQQITNDAGGNKIDQLEYQLNNFEIGKAETEKKLQYLHGRLANTGDILLRAEQYEILSLKVRVTEDALKDALYKLEETKQQRNTMAPAVILVGSE